jgi:hypothetical protein
MIFFVEDGRLGNQAFQLLALRMFFDEYLVLVGFSRLKKLLRSSDFDSVCIIELESLLIKSLITKVIRLLARARIITIYTQYSTPEKYELKKHLGIFRWPRFVDTADFQHPTIVAQIQPSIIALNESWQNKGSKRIQLLEYQYQYRPIVFVHIRRGDYVKWPTVESPAVLSCEWYFRAMSRIQEKIKNPLFVIMTDDIPYAKDIFKDKSHVIIEHNSELLVIALMANCSHGILSASSFSWLGAYLAYSKKIGEESFEESIFVAPDPWIISAAPYVPPSMQTPWMTLIPRTI